MFDIMCSWTLRQVFMMEIEASALYPYIRYGNQINNLLSPPKNPKWTQPKKNPKPQTLLSPPLPNKQNKQKTSNPWEFFKLLYLEKTYSFPTQIVYLPFIVPLKCLVHSCIWLEFQFFCCIKIFLMHLGCIEELGFVWKYLSWYCFWCQ